jgi:acetyl-CoA synthetase
VTTLCAPPTVRRMLIQEDLKSYQRTRRIEFCELPKTISGKICRVGLRQMEQARNAQIRRRQEFREEDFP